MDSSNTMQVNARQGNYPGHGSSQQGRQQQRRQKLMALFEAIESENLNAARQAFVALKNVDSSILSNVEYGRLSKLLDAGSIYQAQQLVKEIKPKFTYLPSISDEKTQVAQPTKISHNGLRLIDLRA